ncbi:MAG: hypothetical protein AB7V50_05095, partial [Vampirovibrionia bacterium]
ADTIMYIDSDSGNITQSDGYLIAPEINITASNGTVGTSSNYIISQSNNSKTNIYAYGNVYLDGLYGDNIYSLKSTNGLTYLRLHNNLPAPVSGVAPPPIPVIEEPVQQIDPVDDIIPEPIPVVEEPELPVEPVNNIFTPTINNSELPLISVSSTIIEEISTSPEVQRVLEESIIIYNEALLNNISYETALDKALTHITNYNIPAEEIKKILDSKLIDDSTYIKLLETYISNNTLTLQN